MDAYNPNETVTHAGHRDAKHTVTDGKINVLFLMIQMAMGGAERLILNLANSLDRSVFAPSIGWFAIEQPLKEFEDLQIPMHYIQKTGGFDWTAAWRVAQIVKEHRIDVINAHHFMPFLYAYCGTRMSKRSGLVYTEHSENDVLALTGKWRVVGSRLLRSCDGVVGVSDRVSAALSAHLGVDGRRLHTIANGVDVELFGGSGPDRTHLRKRLGFGDGDVLIGIVANFRQNKNHVFLLKAFREVVRRHPHARLLFAGQGFPGDLENSETEIVTYIRNNGLEDSVRLLGYQSSAQDLLRALDIFCLVSHKEGLPLSLIEAMAAGLPVVGTAVEGIREVVEPEVNGLVVAPDDVPGLTAALVRLIDDVELRGRMGRAARRKACEKYSLSRCVDETEKLFLSTVLKHSPSRAKTPATPADVRILQ
jgi:glycosyltransferase involved in cell wall biosynthesis